MSATGWKDRGVISPNVLRGERGPPGESIVGPEGPPGPPGESIKGDKGDQGNPGMSGDNYYLHVQNEPATRWIVPHGMGKYPVVCAFDTSGDEIEGKVTHITTALLWIDWSVAVAGQAQLN